MSFSNTENMALRNADNARFENGVGGVFEEQMVRALQRGMAEKQKTSVTPYITPTIGTAKDKCEGTDFIFLDDTHMDVTLNFSHKDFMPVIYESDIKVVKNENINVKYGVRHGNSYKDYTEFATPVVVIGFDIDQATYRKHEDEILQSVEDHASEIFDTAMDVYYDFTISNDDEADRDGIEHIVHKNPNYTQPVNLGNRYQQMLQTLDELEAKQQHINANTVSPNTPNFGQ